MRLAAFLVVAAVGFSTGAQALKPEEIYQKVLPSVMTLRVENARGENFVGTGFVALDRDIAVTAWHVISDAAQVSATFSDNRNVKVVGLIDKDEEHDLALVKLEWDGGSEAALCRSHPLVGSRAYVIGAPKGFEFSITDGLLSQIQKIGAADEYQVSCPISGGNSGGPVLNENGQVIGIVAWTKKDAQNLSFAIPVNYVNRLNAKLPVIPWDRVAASVAQDKHRANSDVDVSESRGNNGDLKSYLKTAAGKHITIIDSDSDRSLSFVVPKDLVK